MQPVILASQSPRRKQLLELSEIEIEVATPDTDESYPDHLRVEMIPEYIALQKALSTQAIPEMKDRVIVAADTIVNIQNDILGKPKNREEAIKMLQKLSNATHRVISGVAILHKDRKIVFHDTTEVTFQILSIAQITHYVDIYKPYDKAGAYAIQEWIGAVGISKINGDYYNVVGLPVSKVVKALQTFY